MERITISKIYKYKPISNTIGLEGRIPVKHKDVFLGVELELEGINQDIYKINSFNAVEDGSLKLSGIELVTVPIKLRYLEMELRRVLDGIKKPTVSRRCSTHVHMNVRDMTKEEVVNLLLLYTIFERGLYRISGDRWLNNFCIPVQECYATVKGALKHWTNFSYWKWNKYIGINLCPIWGGESKSIGTVEFRHLHGTTNVEEIIQWCNLITALKCAAQVIPQDEILAHIRIMNTTSGYAWLANEVFGSYAKLLTNQDTFVEDTEKAIAFLKLIIPEQVLQFKVQAKQEKKKTIYSEMIANLSTSTVSNHLYGI